MDEEDVLRMIAISKKFADTIIDAFERRYPRPKEEAITIIVNSLLLTLEHFLPIIRQPDLDKAIALIIERMKRVTLND